MWWTPQQSKFGDYSPNLSCHGLTVEEFIMNIKVVGIDLAKNISSMYFIRRLFDSK